MNLLIVGALALGMDAICPHEISTAQRAISAPAGWSPLQAHARHILTGFNLYIDDPYKRPHSHAGPTTSIESKHLDRTFYELPPFTKQVWIDCAYTGTAVVLRKRLPDSVRYCEATVDTGSGEISKMMCRDKH